MAGSSQQGTNVVFIHLLHHTHAHTHGSNFFLNEVCLCVAQVSLVDSFTNPKKQLTSHCYRIVYRHMERVLTQEEVNVVHKKIEQEAASTLQVSIR